MASVEKTSSKEGGVSVARSTAVAPLTSRKLDLFYVCFFIFHLFPSFLIDLQVIYPPSLVPTSIAAIAHLYVSFSRDPIMGGAFGDFGEAFKQSLCWLEGFIWVEAFFQVPTFVVGVWALWKGYKSVYPLLLAYGASAATTLLPCIIIILKTPTTSLEGPKTTAFGTASVTESERQLLLWSYMPIQIVTVMLAVDMGWRIVGIVRKADEATARAKTL